MNKLNHYKAGRFFFFNDREIHDGLMSSKLKINSNALRLLAKERGIIISNEDERDDIIDYLSRLNHDYFFFQKLLANIEVTAKRSRMTMTTCIHNNEITSPMIGNALSLLKNSRSSLDEVISVREEGSGRTVVKVNYDDINFSQTPLKQRRPREVEIVIEANDKEVTFRRPANEKAEEIAKEIKQLIDKNFTKAIEEEIITLTGIATPHNRTEFFTEIIKNIDGFRTKDVTSVKVSHKIEIAKPILAKEFTEDDDDVDDDDDDDVEVPEEQTHEDAQMKGVVKAALDGGDLLTAPEYAKLVERGFFIYKMRWQSTELSTGNIFEFEAGFAEPSFGAGFRYDTTGIFKLKKDKVQHNKKRAISDLDRETYCKKLEFAARKSYMKINQVAISSSSTH